MALGAARKTAYASQTGAIIGKELKALGINTNFAPVLDINNNPETLSSASGRSVQTEV